MKSSAQNTLKVRSSAPSNIALIKYMGKTEGNRPVNSSLSWTLDQLRSTFEIERKSGTSEISWEPLAEAWPFQLNEKGFLKIKNHVVRVAQAMGTEAREGMVLRSGNNFPADAGIASSASSFAALTMALHEFFQQMDPQSRKLGLEEQAQLSRQGSGSSCRSFWSPWSMWTADHVGPWEGPRDFHHQAVVVSATVKRVSSSEAHLRCATSLLFNGRAQRAETRLAELQKSLRSGDLRSSFEICWAEFWDMHALFETSQPAFGYLEAGTLQILEKVRSEWETRGEGPIATLDAGPNIHLLWPLRLRDSADRFASEIPKSFKVFGGPG